MNRTTRKNWNREGYCKGQGSRSFFFFGRHGPVRTDKSNMSLGSSVGDRWAKGVQRVVLCSLVRMYVISVEPQAWLIHQKSILFACLLLPAKAVQGIVEWYGSKGIQLAPFNVHFFGDRTENIGPFRQTGFNSHEISCSSRDYQIGNGIVGLCGAQLHEILDTKGVAECWQLDSKY